MKVGWLIDGEMFPEYREELVAAIRAEGHVAKLIHAPNPPFRWDDVGCSYRETFPQGHCVVAHGDIELMTKIHQEKRWEPGAICTVENYYCSNYVVHFGNYWLNLDCMMLPFCDLRGERDSLFDKFGVNGQIFVRPDSPLKLFAGQTASIDTFDADIDFMGFYEFPAESLVVVSTPKEITREWRFVVVRENVVAGCQYSSLGQLDPQPRCDEKAVELATEVGSQGYQPDPVWIIDICQTSDGDFHMLEIGGFSFADLYACDKSAVVREVSAVALECWSDG